MSTSSKGFRGLSPEVMVRINKVCNRFEKQCQSGEQPDVEGIVNELDLDHRDTLLRELIPVEIEHRLRAGLDVSLEQYKHRFPNVDEARLGELLADSRAHTAPAEYVNRTISHYRVQKLLGEGGMGKVFLAQDEALGRECAFKVLAHRFSPNLRPDIEDVVFQLDTIGNQVTASAWSASEPRPKSPWSVTFTDDATREPGVFGVSFGAFGEAKTDATATFRSFKIASGLPPGISDNPGLGDFLPPGLRTGLPPTSSHAIPEPSTALL